MLCQPVELTAACLLMAHEASSQGIRKLISSTEFDTGDLLGSSQTCHTCPLPCVPLPEIHHSSAGLYWSRQALVGVPSLNTTLPDLETQVPPFDQFGGLLQGRSSTKCTLFIEVA